MFRSKFVMIALAAVALVFGSMQLSAMQAEAEIKALTSQVEQLSAEQAIKQAEVNHLAAELELSDFTLSRLLAERESIVAIRTKADAEAERLRTALADAQAKVEQLRVSHDEYVKDWANTVVPIAAVRLLHYANPDGDSHKTSLHTAPAGLVAQLSPDYQF